MVRGWVTNHTTNPRLCAKSHVKVGCEKNWIDICHMAEHMYELITSDVRRSDRFS